MILNKLVEYSQRNETAGAPKIYSQRSLRYIISLGLQGKCHGLIPTEKRMHLPYIKRSGKVIRPYLFADQADYTLGIPADEKTAGAALDRHAAYVQLVKLCAAQTNEPDARAVLYFLQNQSQGQLTLPHDFDKKGIITFEVDGRYVIDNPVLQRFWATINEPVGPSMQCVICGENRPAMERLKSNIKGVPGGPGGADIISANESAFESYGLKASRVAPTCSECAESFTQGLNDLLSRESNRFRTSNGAFVFWTREIHEFDPSAMMSTPNSEQVQHLLRSVYSRRPDDLDSTKFYALALSASKGRIAVRD